MTDINITIDSGLIGSTTGVSDPSTMPPIITILPAPVSDVEKMDKFLRLITIDEKDDIVRGAMIIDMEEIAMRSSEVPALKALIEKYKTESADDDNKIQQLGEENTNLGKKIKEMKTRMIALETAALKAYTDEDVQKLNDKITALETAALKAPPAGDEVTRLRNEITALKDTATREAMQHIENLKVLSEKVQNTDSMYNAMLLAMTKANEQHKREIQQYEQRLLQAKTKRNTAREEIKKLQQVPSSTDPSDIAQKYNEAMAKITQLEKTINDLETENNEFLSIGESNVAAVELKDNEIDTLKQQIKTLESNVSFENARFNTENRKVGELDNKCIELERKVANLTNDLTRVTGERDSANKNVTDTERERDQMEKDKKKAETERNNINTQYQQLATVNQLAIEDLNKEKSKNKKLQAEIEEAKRTIDTNRATFDEKIKQSEEASVSLNSALERLKKEGNTKELKQYKESLATCHQQIVLMNIRLGQYAVRTQEHLRKEREWDEEKKRMIKETDILREFNDNLNMLYARCALDYNNMKFEDIYAHEMKVLGIEIPYASEEGSLMSKYENIGKQFEKTTNDDKPKIKSKEIFPLKNDVKSTQTSILNEKKEYTPSSSDTPFIMGSRPENIPSKNSNVNNVQATGQLPVVTMSSFTINEPTKTTTTSNTKVITQESKEQKATAQRTITESTIIKHENIKQTSQYIGGTEQHREAGSNTTANTYSDSDDIAVLREKALKAGLVTEKTKNACTRRALEDKFKGAGWTKK